MRTGPPPPRYIVSRHERWPAVDLVVGTVSQMREETFRREASAIVGFGVGDLLSTLDIPVLCNAGELDTKAPAASIQKMPQNLKDAEFISLPGLGHSGWTEVPKTFNTALLEFLQHGLLKAR